MIALRKTIYRERKRSPGFAREQKQIMYTHVYLIKFIISHTIRMKTNFKLLPSDNSSFFFLTIFSKNNCTVFTANDIFTLTISCA